MESKFSTRNTNGKRLILLVNTPVQFNYISWKHFFPTTFPNFLPFYCSTFASSLASVYILLLKFIYNLTNAKISTTTLSATRYFLPFFFLPLSQFPAFSLTTLLGLLCILLFQFRNKPNYAKVVSAVQKSNFSIFFPTFCPPHFALIINSFTIRFFGSSRNRMDVKGAESDLSVTKQRFEKAIERRKENIG